MARLPFLFLETCRELDSFAVGYDPSVLSGGDSSTAICLLNGNGGQSRAGLKRKRVAKLAVRWWTRPQGGATVDAGRACAPRVVARIQCGFGSTAGSAVCVAPGFGHIPAPAIATIRGVSRSARASRPPAAFVRCRNPPRHVR